MSEVPVQDFWNSFA